MVHTVANVDMEKEFDMIMDDYMHPYTCMYQFLYMCTKTCTHARALCMSTWRVDMLRIDMRRIGERRIDARVMDMTRGAS